MRPRPKVIHLVREYTYKRDLVTTYCGKRMTGEEYQRKTERGTRWCDLCRTAYVRKEQNDGRQTIQERNAARARI